MTENDVPTFTVVTFAETEAEGDAAFRLTIRYHQEHYPDALYLAPRCCWWVMN